MMNNYDKINVPNFKAGKPNGYLCSMCGQYTTLNDSVSHQGWNLVCMGCESKMRLVLCPKKSSLISMIHKVGMMRQKEENEYGKPE